MDSITEDSSASSLTLLTDGHRLATELSSKLCPAYSPSARFNRKHSFPNCACMLRALLINGRSLEMLQIRNGSIRHIAPSLRLGLRPFLLFRGRCLWRLWSASFSFSVAGFSRWLLFNYSHCSLLKVARPEQLPDKLQAGPYVPSSCSSGRCGKKFREWPAILHFRLIVCSLFFSFGGGNPSTT
jgi:hypothetical protein